MTAGAAGWACWAAARSVRCPAEGWPGPAAGIHEGPPGAPVEILPADPLTSWAQR